MDGKSSGGAGDRKMQGLRQKSRLRRLVEGIVPMQYGKATSLGQGFAPTPQKSVPLRATLSTEKIFKGDFVSY